MNSKKNIPLLFILLLAGLVIGGFIGNLLQDMPYCSWINYGKTFGFDSPISLNLDIIIISFALSIRFSIAGIIGLVIGVFIYKKI